MEQTKETNELGTMENPTRLLDIESRNGTHYTKLWRGELTNKETNETNTFAIYHSVDCGYEFIKIKLSPPTEMFGRTYGWREKYPSSEEFGKSGWSFRGTDYLLYRISKDYIITEDEVNEIRQAITKKG